MKWYALDANEATKSMRDVDVVMALDALLLKALGAKPRGDDLSFGLVEVPDGPLFAAKLRALAASSDESLVRAFTDLGFPREDAARALAVRATVWLGECSGSDALPLVASLLSHEDLDIAAAAAVATSKLDPASCPPPTVVQGSRPLQALFLAGLQSGPNGEFMIEDPRIAWKFAGEVPLVSNPQLLAFLTEKARDSQDQHGRLHAIRVLTQFAATDDVADLLAGILRTEPQERDTALAILHNNTSWLVARKDACREALLGLAGSDDPELAIAATVRLGASGNPDVVRFLLAQLSDPDQRRVHASLLALQVNGAILPEQTRSVVEAMDIRQDRDLAEARGRLMRRIRELTEEPHKVAERIRRFNERAKGEH